MAPQQVLVDLLQVLVGLQVLVPGSQVLVVYTAKKDGIREILASTPSAAPPRGVLEPQPDNKTGMVKNELSHPSLLYQNPNITLGGDIGFERNRFFQMSAPWCSGPGLKKEPSVQKVIFEAPGLLP